MPSHRFLCLLLQFFGLELHHLTPSGVRHIAAFVTLCEAYMGIESHFNMWNYFFHIQLHPDSNGRENDFFYGTTLTCCFLHSRVTVPSLSPARDTVWQVGMPASYNPFTMLFGDCSKPG
jgi:hypothetical protein